MKFSKEFERGLLSALGDKLPERRLICPLCKHETWILTNGFVVLPIQEDSARVSFQRGTALVVAALSCTTCGNTHFINLLTPQFKNLFPPDQTIIEDDIEVRF